MKTVKILLVSCLFWSVIPAAHCARVKTQSEIIQDIQKGHTHAIQLPREQGSILNWSNAGLGIWHLIAEPVAGISLEKVTTQRAFPEIITFPTAKIALWQNKIWVQDKQTRN